METSKTVISTFRYIWKNKEGKLNVKYLTETEEGHEKFKQFILGDENVVSAICEYIQEVDVSKIGLTHTFKTEEKCDEKI